MGMSPLASRRPVAYRAGSSLLSCQRASPCSELRLIVDSLPQGLHLSSHKHSCPLRLCHDIVVLFPGGSCRDFQLPVRLTRVQDTIAEEQLVEAEERHHLLRHVPCHACLSAGVGGHSYCFIPAGPRLRESRPAYKEFTE